MDILSVTKMKNEYKRDFVTLAIIWALVYHGTGAWAENSTNSDNKVRARVRACSVCVRERVWVFLTPDFFVNQSQDHSIA